MSIRQVIIFLVMLATPPLTQAQSEKPALVLLPVQGVSLSSIDQDNYRIALQEALKREYEVYSGGEVESRLKKISAKTCNATECLQEVAISFQGELVSRLVVTPQDGGYILAVEIKNVFDDQLILSRNIPCENCNNFDVVRTLRSLNLNDSDLPDLGTSSMQAKSNEDDSGTSWWVYVLGAVALGALAGGGGDSGGDSAPETGDITITW